MVELFTYSIFFIVVKFSFIILYYMIWCFNFGFGFGLDEWDSYDIFKSGIPALVLYRASFANQPTINGLFQL